MPTQFDLDNARDDDISGLPGDAQELHHLLEQDGTNTRETIAQINQRLQNRIAQFSATQVTASPEPESIATGNVPAPAAAPAPHAIGITPPAPRSIATRRRVTALVTVLATVAVVIAFVAVLSVNEGPRSGGPLLRQTQPTIDQTPPAIDLSGVPLTPVATPGPASKSLTQVVTARARQGNCNPVDPTSYFHVGDAVWVFVILKQAAPSHTISVRWFANGIDVNPPAQDKTTLTLGANTAGVCFSLQYPSAGTGSVKVYWDRPANDTGDDPNDKALMATINFAVLPPGYGTPTSGLTGATAPTMAPVYANADRIV
ncbi:MAG: hypothetical protein ACM3N4_09205 [Nitrososphaerota archaeon]